MSEDEEADFSRGAAAAHILTLRAILKALVTVVAENAPEPVAFRKRVAAESRIALRATVGNPPSEAFLDGLQEVGAQLIDAIVEENTARPRKN